MTSPDIAQVSPKPNDVSSMSGPDDNLGQQASVANFESIGQPRRPVEDLHDLLLRISHHLDFETSERTTIYHRLRLIDEQTKKVISQTKRGFFRRPARYLVAICLGVIGTLAWQTYGEATKRMIATTAPELGWSPQTKQVIAAWMDELGWTNPPTGAETAPLQPPAAQAAVAADTVAPNTPAAPSVDPEQVQQIAQGLAAVRQTLDQIASGQNQMQRDIGTLQAANTEILAKIPAPAPQPRIAAQARKPIATSPQSRGPVPAR
jgi:hypothetical protein